MSRTDRWECDIRVVFKLEALNDTVFNLGIVELRNQELVHDNLAFSYC